MVPSSRTLDVEPGPPVLPDTAWEGGTPVHRANKQNFPRGDPPVGFLRSVRTTRLPTDPSPASQGPCRIKEERESHSPPESQPTRPLFHFSWSELSTLGAAGATGSQTAPTSPTCSHTLCSSLQGFQVRHRFVRLVRERRLAPCAGGQEREGGRLARSTQDSLWMKAGGLAERASLPPHTTPSASQPCSAILPTCWHAD